MKPQTAVLLPLLIAVIPIVFLYSHNVDVLYIGNLISPLLITGASVFVFYGLFSLYYRDALSASFSVVIMVIANYLYGFSYYSFFVKMDLIPVEHFILLPLFLFFSFFTAYFFNFLSVSFREAIHKILLIVALFLVSFNLFSAVPSEIRKLSIVSAKLSSANVTSSSIDLQKRYPDVYFIILDEYAGLDVIRNYWHANYVDSFETYLNANNFLVLDKSHSSTSETIMELASRLNLKEYPKDTRRFFLHKEIINNRVMKLFKSYGYTTVAFQGPYQPYLADYNFGRRPGSTNDQAVGTDEFREVLIDNSMFSAFSGLFSTRPSSLDSLNSSKYVFQKISDLSGVPSPKLVIAHIYFPHTPFVVDKDGNVLDSKDQYNWSFYLGQHQYATEQSQALISRLLENADPANPPVIVIQSDHGARNMKIHCQSSVNLENYPSDYQYHILNAMHLPGFTSQLSTDVDPIETFVIILNHYLNADVKVDRLGGE
jgi:hypothetical protein